MDGAHPGRRTGTDDVPSDRRRGHTSSHRRNFSVSLRTPIPEYNVIVCKLRVKMMNTDTLSLKWGQERPE